MVEGHTMRHGTRASTTAYLVVAIASLCAASCARPPPRPAAREAPARSLTVTDARISLRASAFVELHLWLAAASKTDADVGPELDPAKRAYTRSLQDDDQDVLVERTTRALSACSDDRCASAALASEGFGRSYERALPAFIARSWLGRASSAWIGIEAAHGALEAVGPAVDVLLTRVASDLGTSWPDGGVTVDVVSEAPPVGRAALAPIAFAAHGRCFLRDPQGDERANQARILDCLLVHALLATAEPRGTLHDAMVRELGDRDGERAWSLLVIHAVAAVVTGWTPKHRSVYRRSAEAAEQALLDWLAREWPKARIDGLPTFGARFAAQWREMHR
jgi:hypothetical protein